MRKYIAVILTICLIWVNMSVAFSAEDTFSVEINIDRTGHIFTDKAIPFKLVLDNTGADKTLNIEIKAVSENGRDIRTLTINKTIASGVKSTQKVTLNVGEYGFYDLIITAKNENNGDVLEKATRFSVVKKSEKFNNKIGLNSHYAAGRYTDGGKGKGLEKVSELQALFADTGIGRVREGVTWDHYEASDGKYGLNDSHKKVLTAFKQNGQSNLLILGHENNALGIMFPKTEAEMLRWEAYVRNLVAELKAGGYGITDFEVWNEVSYHLDPNSSAGYIKITAAEYAEMLKRTYKIIHDIIPEAKVYAFSLASNNDHILLQEDVLQYIYDTEGGRADCFDGYFDGISIHPYNMYGRPEDSIFEIEIDAQLALMKKWGIEDKSLIISELGYTDAESYVSTDEQARYAVRMSALGAEKVDYIDWYVNLEKIDTDYEKEIRFGWLKGWKDQEINYEAKPVFIAMANYNSYMAGSEYKGEQKILDGDGYIKKYKQDGKDVYMIWKIHNSAEIDLDLGCASVEISDMYGNTKTVMTENGILHMSVSENPQYITGNFSECTEHEPSIVLSENELRLSNGRSALLNIKSDFDEDYSVNAEMPSGVRLTQNSGFVSGRAALEFSAEKDVKSGESVEVNILDGIGNVIFTKDIYIENHNAVDVSAECIVTIAGHVPQAGVDIVAAAIRPEASFEAAGAEDILFADFVRTDEYGNYTIKFKDSSPQKGRYKVRLRVGEALSENVYEYEVDVPRIMLTEDGNEIKHLSDIIKTGVKAELIVQNMISEELSGRMICAQYKDKRLVRADMLDLNLQRDLPNAQLPVDYAGSGNVDEIKIFLWSKGGNIPLTDNVYIN